MALRDLEEQPLVGDRRRADVEQHRPPLVPALDLRHLDRPPLAPRHPRLDPRRHLPAARREDMEVRPPGRQMPHRRKVERHPHPPGGGHVDVALEEEAAGDAPGTGGRARPAEPPGTGSREIGIAPTA